MKKIALAALLLPLQLLACPKVQDAWVRPAIKDANTAGFATITPDNDMALIGVDVISDPICQTIELHTHIHEGDVMKMVQVDSFDLKKDQVFSLQPGGDHVMFMSLLNDVKEGDMVKLNFKFKKTDGSIREIKVDASVKTPDASVETSN